MRFTKTFVMVFADYVNGYTPGRFAPVLLPVLVQMGTVHFLIMVLMEPAQSMRPHFSRWQELLSNWPDWCLSEGDRQEPVNEGADIHSEREATNVTSFVVFFADTTETTRVLRTRL